MAVTEKPKVFETTDGREFKSRIAREGEQQFACILRNRSGQSAGEIDMGVRDVTILCDAEQQDVVDTAYAIYETVCDQTKKKARRDV